jgi:hypothetical protein
MSERPATPDIFDTVRAMFDQFSLELHTALPGRIESYDAATQTATVQPTIRHPVPQPDGSMIYEAYPQITSVPIVMPRSGKAFVSLPVAAGDGCLVVMLEASPGEWRSGDGAEQHPGDLRRHHLAHGVAIVGLDTRGKALTHASATDIVIGFDDGSRITIKRDGSVHIADDAGSPLAMANATNSQLNDLKTAIDGWTPVPNDGGAALKTALTAWDSGYRSGRRHEGERRLVQRCAHEPQITVGRRGRDAGDAGHTICARGRSEPRRDVKVHARVTEAVCVHRPVLGHRDNDRTLWRCQIGQRHTCHARSVPPR